jgi:aspartyl/asparaginyl beta-hydroxylase (cupin superfamily)
MIEKNFEFYGNYDTSRIIKKIDILDWNYFTWRQENRPGLEYTETIPLIWENNFSYYNTWKYFDLFKTDLDELKVILTDILGPGNFITAVFTKLYAGQSIAPHRDVGYVFHNNPRIHIPLITNPNCIFTVGEESINMKQGEMWEINNANKIHSVHNKGTTDRIHLMMDWELNDQHKNR